MSEQERTAPPETEEPAPSAPEAAESDGDTADGNSWLRETAQGLIYSRPLDTAKRNQELSDAAAELRRGRRNGRQQEGSPEEKPPAESGEESAPEASKSEPSSSAGVADDAEFQRRVQAEVDRREAIRRQRAETQYERDLRQKDPEAYAKYVEQKEAQAASASTLTSTLQKLSQQFDEATVTPLMQALPDDDARNSVLKDAGHGIPGRKEIVTRAIAALKKAAYEEGLAKGKESAQKSLRRSSSFRKELLSELREGEDEPELAPGNGNVGGGGWDMNDWMRQMTGRGTRSRSRE